ncbi:transposase-like protein [Corynebacterium diphtheriae PW8]|nr:transposase-like protein [Corynebacterium diphtheriae PW8]
MTSPVGGLKNCLTSTTTTHHYNRPSTTTNKQAAKKGRSMNKRPKDILAYIRHTINAF